MTTKEYLPILESQLKDHKFIKHLKLYAVDNQMYEFAAQTRNFEKANFEESKDTAIIENAKRIKTSLSMAGINVDLKLAYKLFVMFDLIYERGQNLDIKSVSDMQAKADEIFD